MGIMDEYEKAMHGTERPVREKAAVKDPVRKDTMSLMRDARKAEKENDPETAGKLFERVLVRLDSSISDEMRIECLEGMLRTGRRTPAYILEWMEGRRTGLEGKLGRLYKVIFTYLDAEIRKERRSSRKERLFYLLDSAILTIKDMLLVMGSVPVPDEGIRRLFRMRYQGDPRLDSLIIKYFRTTARNLLSKIRGFEHEMALVEGAFVLLDGEGKVGRITDITGSIISVNLGGRERPRSIYIDDAMHSLSVLSKKDLRVIRKAVPSEKILSRMMEDPRWMTETAVYTLTRPDRKKAWCSLDDIRDLLVPDFFSRNVWRQAAGAILRNAEEDPDIRTLHGAAGDLFRMSPYPLTMDDKAADSFRISGYFDDRVAFTLELFEGRDLSELEDTSFLIKEYFMERYTSGTPSERAASAVLLDAISSGGRLVADGRKTAILLESMAPKEREEALDGINEKSMARVFSKSMERQ